MGSTAYLWKSQTSGLLDGTPSLSHACAYRLPNPSQYMGRALPRRTSSRATQLRGRFCQKLPQLVFERESV